MNEIRNTTADMNAPDSTDRLLLLLTAMDSGSASSFIENQERAGQQQLVRSQMLPTDARETEADFVAAGFTFGTPLSDDPMFRPATLPAGWSKVGSDHDMWSYVVDELSRRRVAIFYKAAFYDRRAFMRLVGVAEYVYSHIGGYDGYEQLLTDSVWATPDAVRRAALDQAAEHEKQIEEYAGWLKEPRQEGRYGRHEHAEKYLPGEVEKRDACLALAERFAADGAE